MSTPLLHTTEPPNIPPQLQDLDQWVACKGKQPINPHTGRLASPTDPTTWGTLEQALAAVDRYQLDGFGLGFARDGKLVGIDLDHCRNPETGEIQPWAQAIVDRFPYVYWEVSRSGTGLHGIGYGTLPIETSGKHPGGIGVFQHSRYFVMTGKPLPGYETLGAFGDDLTIWYHETFPPESPHPAAAPARLTLDDQDIIDRLRRQNDGGMAGRLLDGDLCGKTSTSEARFALASRICFYSDDVDQIARVLRGVPLWSAKDRDRDRDRKAAHDARQAIAKYSGERYTPSRPHEPPPQDIPAGATCDQQLKVALETIAIQAAKLKAAEGTIATLRERVRRGDERWAVARNTKLGAARQTAAVLPSLFQDERAKDPNSTTGYRVPLDRLADRTGLSPETCSKHLRQLAKYQTIDGSPVLHVETRDIPRQVNQSTGEIVEPHKEVWIGPGPIQQDAFGHVLATLEPAEAPKHGGAPDRNACPDHPFAGVIRRTKTTRKVTRECAHCNTILNATIVPIGTPTAEFIPASAPIQQDAFGHESGNPGQAPPMPQHAASTSSHTRGMNQSSNMRHSPVSDEENPSDYWSGHDGVAGDDAWTGAGWRSAC